MRKKLSFSNPFFSAFYLEHEESVSEEKYGIFVNLGTEDIRFDASGTIRPYTSYLFKNYEIRQNIDKGILLTFDFDPARDNADLNTFCRAHWDTNKIRYPDNPERWKYKILRSPVDKIGNLEINCWFLPGSTASSIHREHPFREVHTQLYGLGIMNKFTGQEYDSLYQRMFMPPGFTHDPFFDADGVYPWHQYEAVTNSIWMAVCHY